MAERLVGSKRSAGELSARGEGSVDIGRIGIWTFQFEQQPWAAVAEAAAELDELGYGALWFPEGRGGPQQRCTHTAEHVEEFS